VLRPRMSAISHIGRSSLQHRDPHANDTMVCHVQVMEALEEVLERLL
jgi:hypothetical protein